jgi:hypothetical protein
LTGHGGQHLHRGLTPCHWVKLRARCLLAECPALVLKHVEAHRTQPRSLGPRLAERSPLPVIDRQNESTRRGPGLDKNRIRASSSRTQSSISHSGDIAPSTCKDRSFPFEGRCSRPRYDEPPCPLACFMFDGQGCGLPMTAPVPSDRCHVEMSRMSKCKNNDFHCQSSKCNFRAIQAP